MIATLTPAQQERMLDLANALVASLAKVKIHRVGDPNGEVLGLGVPASVMSHVTSFLYRERNAEAFRRFVDRLDQLDDMVGQNQENPRAQHAAVKGVLKPWLVDHSDLKVEEWLYVLSWARRLLPKDPSRNGLSQDHKKRSGHRPGDTRFNEVPRDREPEKPAKGDQMAQALARAWAKKPRDE